MTTPLPLARSRSGQRTGESQRNTIDVPEGARRQPERFAVAALAALIHRYTGELGVTVGARRLRVPGEGTVGELLAAAAAAQPAAEPDGHGIVVPAGADVPEVPPALVLVLSASEEWELRTARAEFPAEAAAQYAGHLERILHALAGDPAVALRDIALLDAAETRRALFEWNANDEAVPAPFLHELVAEYARGTPEAVAVALPDSQVTYRELDESANQLAHRLAKLGVRPRDRVGVCFPRGADALIAQLACFKLAVGVILMDPDFPADRLRFMLTDAEAAAVLTSRADESAVDGVCKVISLDGTDWRTEPTTFDPEPVTADDIIHIGYTSGSTGTPKGVLARFGSCRNLIHSMRAVCELTAASNGTWLAAPGYGMIQVECFPVLAAGATVHIPEISVVASPQRLQEWLLERRIDSTLLMKPMAERLWGLDWPADTPLRNIRVCGERIQSWPPPGLPFRLINLYGSTEATTVAGCDITSLGAELGEQGRALRLPPIGRPIANVKTYVLDDALRPVPPGVAGELCVSGDGLSVGYLNRPELTEQRWIPNPIDPARSPVLYRTGDMARYWPDGGIELIGRTDNQIKVRGNTVHLGEIEVVLTAQPGVRQAAVLAHQDGHGDTQLAAYLEPSPGLVPAVPDIRRAVQQRLPAFMVPASYVVGVFPTSTNGKIDRTALPEPPRSRPDVNTPYQEPRTDLERTLRDLWQSELEVEGVGILDNFFELGGDSLRAARLTEELRDRYAIELELGDLFDEPSVERMAALVRHALAGR
ncbi:non-ribosomal peptide synthetase [Amycolatopsis cihanbeyliensis]|uniref:Amino acid adenylation domain-containing protein n=1 Tax=Amycolatopsis cihanbeyliensis TaxID=1128664 RepID=A0A542DPX3_AMYCI|nr:non-ribosomal peptide synthetase [Amycolatopsis cihanbeyliensis]TQJ05142.1 amino acid adenylation domain-containing protein [Amycolatopsis cihanbeyliensis]